MPYFHCHLIVKNSKKDESYFLNDCSLEDIKKNIFKPYVEGKQFTFDGYMIAPSEVRRLKASETSEPAQYYINSHYDKMGTQIIDLATRPASLAVGAGKDITQEIIDELAPQVEVDKKEESESIMNTEDIFVVHGHDMASLHELCRILQEDIGYNPIVLSEQPSVGLDTIMSKFERKAKECFAAIILLTPDDKVESEEHRRARQNVIFELGYFLGMWQDTDKRKIMVLHKAG